jgi:hypothetical protein
VRTLASTFALILPSYVIYVALRRVWRRLPEPPNPALAVALAPGIALGLASCIYFGLLLVRDRRTALSLDTGFWLVAVFWLLVAGRRGTKRSGRKVSDSRWTTPTDWNSTVAIAAAGLFTLLALAMFSVGQHWVASPHGTWDTIAIWNLRARAIARNGTDLSAVVSPSIGWSHPDYPLLLPLTIGRLWEYLGRESTVVPVVVALLFLVSTVAVLVVSIGSNVSWAAGIVAGTAMLMARTYVAQASCMCADLPVSFFLLVAVCFAAMSLQDSTSGPMLIVAGAAAGLAAWTKDEGIVLLGVVCLFVLVNPASRRGRRLSQVLLGAATPAIALAIFKSTFAPPGYLFTGQTVSGLAAKLGDGPRWSLVGSRFAELLPAWGEVPGGAFAAAAIAAALMAGPDRQSARRAVAALLIVSAMLLSYAAVYVITPVDVRWQIATSFDRLVTQLWPAAVWAGFQLTSVGHREKLAVPQQ